MKAIFGKDPCQQIKNSTIPYSETDIFNQGNKALNADNKSYYSNYKVSARLLPCLAQDYIYPIYTENIVKLKNLGILQEGELQALSHNIGVEYTREQFPESTFYTGGIVIGIPFEKFLYWNPVLSVAIMPDILVSKVEDLYMYDNINGKVFKDSVIHAMYQGIGDYIYYRDYNNLLNPFTKTVVSCYGHKLTSGSGEIDKVGANPAAGLFSSIFADIAVGHNFNTGGLYTYEQFQYIQNTYFSGADISNTETVKYQEVLQAKQNLENGSYLGCREVTKKSRDIKIKTIGNNTGDIPDDFKTQVGDIYDRVLFVLRKEKFLSDEDEHILLTYFDLYVDFVAVQGKNTLEYIVVPTSNLSKFINDGGTEKQYNHLLNQGWYTKGSKPSIHIVLTQNTLEKKDLDLNLREQEKWIEQSLYHEIGHYLNYKSFENIKNFYTNFYSICWDSKGKSIKMNCDRDFVSSYSKSNPHEDFAETFKVYILYKSVIKEQLGICKTKEYNHHWENSHGYINFKSVMMLQGMMYSEINSTDCFLSSNFQKKFEFIESLGL
ncbi:hypothetical protein HOO68_04875 [Candidatus Gracilibacteria bacterium]|nr:hypothetical protein [Candidatus Gracilibacteria bacterium]